MRLRLTRRATNDLGDIAEYIRERNPQAAVRVRAAIDVTEEIVILSIQHPARQREYPDA